MKRWVPRSVDVGEMYCLAYVLYQIQFSLAIIFGCMKFVKLLYLL